VATAHRVEVVANRLEVPDDAGIGRLRASQEVLGKRELVGWLPGRQVRQDLRLTLQRPHDLLELGHGLLLLDDHLREQRAVELRPRGGCGRGGRDENGGRQSAPPGAPHAAPPFDASSWVWRTRSATAVPTPRYSSMARA